MGEAHLRAYAAQPGVRIVGLATRTAARGSELTARYPIENVYGSAVELLEDARPDGVSVTTSEHEHVEPTITALERGVGVLLEKPIASNVADAERIAEAADAHRVPVVPAHVLRFTPTYRHLREEVVAGSIGEVVAISARRDRPRFVARHYARVHPAYLTAVHDIDLVLWLTGSRVARVRALQRSPSGGQAELIWAHLELASGALAAIAAAHLHPDGGTVSNSDRLEVYGTSGVAVVDFTIPPLVVHAGPSRAPDWLLEPPDGGGAFGAEIAHFCDCLRRGRPSDVVTLAEAVAGIRVADAMVRSATSGGADVWLDGG
jgi:predicted dehydrogenase